MLTPFLLFVSHLFLGATSVYTPSDNPVAKLKTEPANLVSQLKSKANKGDGEAAFKLYKIYFEDQNEKEWRTWLQKSADLNFPEGLYITGLLLFENKTATKEDKDKGIKYYFSAAEKGNAEAQASIGDCYLWGDYFEIDEKKALYWYRLAADNNHGPATNNLASFYDIGRCGLSIDKKQAIKLYMRAAYLNSSYAQNTLGITYAIGDLLEKNNAEAFAWMWIAADNENENALENLEQLVTKLTSDEYTRGRTKIDEIRESIKQGKCNQSIILKENITEVGSIDKSEQSEISEFQKNFIKAQSGDAHSQLEVALSYKDGKGIQQSDKEAFYWFKKSAKQGVAKAQCCLGLIYAVGNSFVKPNYQESFKWFELSAAQNETEAIYSLGVSYQNGNGVIANQKKALEYYKKAADLGHETAQSNYGNYFLNKVIEKNGSEADEATALKYLKLSAKQMHRESFIKLGVYYFFIKNNSIEGLAWFYVSYNCFCYQKKSMELFLNDQPAEVIEKAQKRSDQLIKELLHKNEKVNSN